jgi:hypothetical protein
VSIVRDLADLERLLDVSRKEIEEAQERACAWVSFYIKDRLIELGKLFPGHEFTYSHAVYGTGLSVEPALHGRTDLDDLEGDLVTRDKKRFKGSTRLSQIVADVGDLASTIEDEFDTNPGRITIYDGDDD